MSTSAPPKRSSSRLAHGRKWAALSVALLTPSACSLAVSTDGLSGGAGADGALSQADAGSVSAEDGGSLLVDRDGSISAADGSVPTQPGDGSSTADGSTNDAYIPPADGQTPDAPDLDEGIADAGTSSHDAGIHDAGHEASVNPTGDGAPCSGDLAYFGTGNFSIAFSMRTTTSGVAALLNQRSKCGPSMFWDVRFSSGQILAETDDVTNSTSFTTTGPAVNDGATHAIVVQRTSGTMTVLIDGRNAGSAPSAASLGALPTLMTTTDVCDGQDGTAAFEGTISDVCVGVL